MSEIPKQTQLCRGKKKTKLSAQVKHGNDITQIPCWLTTQSVLESRNLVVAVTVTVVWLRGEGGGILFVSSYHASVVDSLHYSSILIETILQQRSSKIPDRL